jgi:hypothetical protein
MRRCSKMSSLPPRPGSVVVKHDVLLKTHYTPAYKEIFKQAKQQVEEKIQNATKTQTSNSTNYCSSKFLLGQSNVQRRFNVCPFGAMDRRKTVGIAGH